MSRRPAADQVPVWEPPARDQTPIETGGAVLIVRLTPADTAYLLTLAPTLHEAVHELLVRGPGGQR